MTKAKHVEPPFEEDPPPSKDDDEEDAPGIGHNSQSKREQAWARILPAARKLDEKIEQLLKAHIDPLRKERNELFAELANDYGIPTKVRVARYSTYRIEMDAIDKGDDITLQSLHEAYQATPVGKTVSMFDVNKRADEKRAQQEAEKAAKLKAKEDAKKTAVAEEVAT